MSYVRHATLILLAAGLIAGCGDDDEPADEPANGPLVTYQRSGGVAGVLEELRIERDGAATVIVGPNRERAEFTLDETELDELTDELESAELDDPEEPPGDPGCNDCFAYRIEYAGEELTWDDLDEPSPPLQAIADRLGEIVAANYPPD